MKELPAMLDRYHKIVKAGIKSFNDEQNPDSFLRSKECFDEVYKTIIGKDLRNRSKVPHLEKLSDLTQPELDNVL